MHEYLCTFYVNGIRTEEIVRTNGSYAAQKIIEARYVNAKISFSSIKRLS